MNVSAGISQSMLFPETKTIFDRYILDRLCTQTKHLFIADKPEVVFQSWKNAGAQSIELIVSAYLKKDMLEKMCTVLKQHHVTVVSIHQPQAFSHLISISLQEIENLCTIAVRLSVKVIVLHIDALGKRIFDDTFVSALKNMEKKFGIIFGIENSPKYLLTLHKPYAWREKDFCSVIEKNDFHITFDTTHVAQVGGDIIAFYKQNKQRIVNIHISDFQKTFLGTKMLFATGQHLPLGAGELPINEFLQTLKETHYSGLITMEIDSDLEGLCASAEIINQYTR